jgi:hypothetical protein
MRHVVRMEDMKMHTKCLSKNDKRTDPLEDLCLDEEDTIQIYFM